MKKEEIYATIAENPVFHLATVEGNQPRVRGMLLYKADETGILFHTGAYKDLAKQVSDNNKAELCFNAKGTQVRISGELIRVTDVNVLEEIYNSPSRVFIRDWVKNGVIKDYYKDVIVYKLQKPLATIWTMNNNFTEKTYIEI